MKEVFEIQNPAYNFRAGATYFKRENVKKNHYGIQSVGYFGAKLWDTVPNNIKNCSWLNKVKNSIKSWKSNECPYRLCKKYITQVGFIWFTSSFCNISEEKKLYIFCIFCDFSYTDFSMGKFHVVFRDILFFLAGAGTRGGGGERVHRLCRFFWRFVPEFAETVHFLGTSLQGIVWNFCIFAVVVTIFCIC